MVVLAVAIIGVLGACGDANGTEVFPTGRFAQVDAAFPLTYEFNDDLTFCGGNVTRNNRRGT
jgi:hypothetical protein